MPGPNCFIVSYDVSAATRLRRIHRLMKGFGDPLHYSVFRCHLIPQWRVEMIAAITDVIKHDEDRVMVIDLGPSDTSIEKRIDFLGVHPPEEVRQAHIF